VGSTSPSLTVGFNALCYICAAVEHLEKRLGVDATVLIPRSGDKCEMTIPKTI